jgi:DNA-binding LacI/PurR family transcriptional regulator
MRDKRSLQLLRPRPATKIYKSSSYVQNRYAQQLNTELTRHQPPVTLSQARSNRRINDYAKMLRQYRFDGVVILGRRRSSLDFGQVLPQIMRRTVICQELPDCVQRVSNDPPVFNAVPLEKRIIEAGESLSDARREQRNMP